MPAEDSLPPRPPRNLPAHHRRTERWLVLGFVLLLLLVGGGLIAWTYGWGGLAGGLVSILGCTLALAAVGGLLWLLLTWGGRWANGE